MAPLMKLRQAAEPPKFYSVSEVAKMFGASEMTVYRAIHAGQFPAIRLRGRFIVPAKAIDEMVEASMQIGLVDASDWVRDEAENTSASLVPGLDLRGAR